MNGEVKVDVQLVIDNMAQQIAEQAQQIAILKAQLQQGAQGGLVDEQPAS